MGTYMISAKEIVSALEEALNNLEGDLTHKQLKKALYVIKFYPYVSDILKCFNKYDVAKSEL